MRCIRLHTPSIPLSLHLNYKQPLRTAPRLWLSSNEPSELFLRRTKNLSPPATRPNAVPDFLVLGAPSAAKPGGDITVLLLTSAALFFLYFIANFVVPNFITKSLQLDNGSENQKRKDDNSI